MSPKILIDSGPQWPRLTVLLPLAIFLRLDVFGPLMPKVLVELAQRWW